MSFITILLPVYNEEDLIEESLKSLNTILDKLTESYEILCIDDGSTDSTWDILKQKIESSAHIRGLRLSRNFGKENALAAGLEGAKGDAVVIVDSDGQHPYELIPLMIQAWKSEGVPVVEGLKREDHLNAPVRRILSQAYYSVFYLLSGLRMKGSSDFLLLDRQVVERWKDLPEYHIFFRGLIRWMSFPTKKIYYSPAVRHAGRTKFTARKLLRLSVNSIVSFSSIPLYLISLLGLAFLFFAAVMVLQTLFLWFSGDAVEGFTTVIMLQLFIGGLILSALGIIGIYVARLFEEIKKRPRYLVSEHLESSASQ